MGTKRKLASSVDEIVRKSQPGPFLDLFSGMCTVATTVAPKRQIWTNDFQYFAQTVSIAHFQSQDTPPSRMDAIAYISEGYFEHTKAHLAIASARVTAEEEALKSENSEKLNQVYLSWQNQSRLPGWKPNIVDDAHLFRDTFSGAFFGISQSIEIDAIRYSLDKAKNNGIINEDCHRWLILALCVAMNKCTTSTGHFAQPLTAKQSNIKRFSIQRRKSIRENWLSAIDYLQPIGTADWRKSNRAIRGDALICLENIAANEASKPAVVYADPPYTSDQYSRYYHVYDTLIRYDYPNATGRGLYRPDREVSDFSLASKVHTSIERIIRQSAQMGADIILSYPSVGLLKGSREYIPEMMRNAYGRDPQVLEIDHVHSTMGGSKGAGKQSVKEIIYRAYH